jgi:MFS family permease
LSVLIGAVLLGLALVLASQAASLIQFQLTYGILVGLAASAFFAPMIAAATAWFEQNRSLAVSLVSAGMGVAPMTISPFARWLISTYDWRTAMLTIGILAWSLLLPAALLVRRAPTVAATPGIEASSGFAADTVGMSAAQAPHDAFEPRYGIWSVGRRLDLRHVRCIQLAVHRLVRRGARSGGDSARLPAAAARASSTGMMGGGGANSATRNGPGRGSNPPVTHRRGN